MGAMSFSPTPAIDRLRDSLEQANRVITRLTWIIAGCTILLLIAAVIQISLQLRGCR